MGFEDSDELLESYLARAGKTAAAGGRLWGEGREVGEWTVAGFVGRGGSAEVYCARNRRLGTAAVLKVLWRDEAGPKERFLLETRFLMESGGGPFPAFYGAGEEDGRPWLAMELLEEYPLPSGDKAVAAYLLDVARAVEELHRRGWVHRDLKPRNILRRALDGRAVLADFGLLKKVADNPVAETAAERVSPSILDGREVGVGTPGYAAPEQFAGGAATPAPDVHALGVLADECFSGKPPRAWERIIRRATGSLPRLRYGSASAMARAIRRRHWPRNAAAAVLLCTLVATAAVAWWRSSQENVSELSTPSELSESSNPPALSKPLAAEEPAATPESEGEAAERAREAAIRRASEGPGREVVDAMLRDMVELKGADKVHKSRWEADDGEPGDPFWMGRHEVTQAQWEALMENNPSRFKGADRPVDGVGIGDCLEFIGRLNRMPNVVESGMRFRLPTRDEWNLAAGWPMSYRPNLETSWFADNSGRETHPVGEKPPDARGLCDLFGNVAEVVSDGAQLRSMSFEVTGMCCMGGSCIQRPFDLDDPILLVALGREIETLPEEFRPMLRASGIPVQVPESLAEETSESAGPVFGHAVVGLRLCADKTGEASRQVLAVPDS